MSSDYTSLVRQCTFWMLINFPFFWCYWLTALPISMFKWHCLQAISVECLPLLSPTLPAPPSLKRSTGGTSSLYHALKWNVSHLLLATLVNKRYNKHLPQTWCMFGKDLCLGDILNNNNILSPGGIKNKQFIEHMEYRGHLYGTTFEAVEEVPQSSNWSHWRNEIVN